jgi:hypothetical protein
LNFNSKEVQSQYIGVFDFANAETGLDLWLFAKATNLRENFAQLAALLTPNFDGRVWYEKDSKNLLLKIFAVPIAMNVLTVLI